MFGREPLLALDRRFTHLVEDGSACVLVGDDDTVLLEGQGLAALLTRLDGSRTALDLAYELEDVHRPEIVHFAILRLQSNGVICPVEPGAAATEDLSPLGRVLRGLWEGRGERSVVLVPARYAPGAARVLLTDDYLHPDVTTVVEGVLAEDPGASVLLARPGVRSVWVGPEVGPGRVCLGCLQERLSLNLTGRAYLRARRAVPDEADNHAVVVRRLDRDLPAEAYILLAESLTRVASETGSVRCLHEIKAETGYAVQHHTDSLVGCPACSAPNARTPGADFSLQPRPLTEGSGGGFRTCRPDETWERYRHLVSPLTGIVRRIEKVEVGACEGVHVYTASHAATYGARSVKAVKDDARDHSGGKGATDLDARVSALCESLERFSSVHRGTEEVRWARQSELGDEAIGPDALQLFSEAQFRGREAWNQAQAGHFQWVPEPYADERIAWSPVRSLVSGERRWVPSTLVFLGYRGEDARFGKGDSNGLAGGNCLEEALLQGLFELVERDGIALWWYNRVRLPGVDLSAIDDPVVRHALGLYPALGRRLWALDLTTDLGIPTYAVLSALEHGEREDIVFGFGAHLDPGIALRRAVTELNQMLPTVLRTPQERERQLLPEFKDAVDWWDSERLEAHPYLLPDPARPPRPLRAHPYADPGDVNAALDAAVTRIAARGHDVLAYDLTRVEVGLSVAKVFAPGLRHFWRRTAPGRLYDAPVTVGWASRGLTEGELNPISMFV